MSGSFLTAYEALVGSENIDDTADPPVLFPPNEHLLCEIVRKAFSDTMKIAVTGKGTFPVPHSIRDGIVVSTAALSSVLEVSPEDFIIRIHAGVIVDDAVREAEKYGLLMPLDSTSGNMATVGGAYMANAVGPSAASYGAFRESVIGGRYVTADGTIVTGGGNTAKNVTGYDITRFLAGTMGLFAIAFELTLTVHTVPESRRVVVACFLSGLNTIQAIKKIISSVKNFTMLELIALDGLGGETTVGVGFEGMGNIVQHSTVPVKDILNAAGANAVYEESRGSFMTTRRQAARNMVGPGFITISVPPSSSWVLMERILTCSDHIPVVAHPAIGRFHVVCSNKELISRLQETALAVGGNYPVAWNRIGKEGVSCLFSEAERNIARSLKRELDPRNILNPHLKML